MSPVRVTLITRHDCHLCEEMAAVLAEVGRELPFEIEVRDVDADPELRARYSDEVPVLFVGGRKAFKYRVSADQLRRRLRAERGRGWLRRWLPTP